MLENAKYFRHYIYVILVFQKFNIIALYYNRVEYTFRINRKLRNIQVLDRQRQHHKIPTPSL